MVRWPELRACTAGGAGSITGRRMKTLNEARCSQKKKKEMKSNVPFIPLVESYLIQKNTEKRQKGTKNRWDR